MGAWMAITTGLGAGVAVASANARIPASGAIGFEMAITLEAVLDDRSTFAKDIATNMTLDIKRKPSVRTILHRTMALRRRGILFE